MKINWIELKGFKRMSLSNINFIKITPSERIQLVLGTNGSGKSSLMGELSPLPAIQASYDKDGYKTISITHLGDEYVLNSRFHPSQKHSIIKNGTEELNTGGTVTVQKDLVKAIFGYRQDIHDLLTGVEKFSTMSPSLRRKWFTELCETNYDYAIGVYNKISERSRDTSGALKLSRKRLVVETSKIISSEEIEKIHNDTKSLLREIDLLYNSRTEDHRDTSEIIRDQKQLEIQVFKFSDRVATLSKFKNGQRMSRPDELTLEIEHIKHDVTRINTQTSMLFKTHEELKEKYEAYTKSGVIGLEDLQRRYNDLVLQKTELQNKKQLKLAFDNPVSTQAAILSIFDLLERITHEMSPNADKCLSHEALQAAKDKEYQLRESVRKANSIIEQLQYQRKHMEGLRDGTPTECPDCRHRWVPGYSAEALNKVSKSISHGNDFLERSNREISELQKVIEENTKYGEQMREYMRCVRTLPILNPFWDVVKDTIYVSPMHVYREVEKLKTDLEYDIKCLELDTEQIKNNSLIELAIKSSDADIGKMSETLHSLEAELSTLAQDSRQKQNLLQVKQQELLRSQEIIKLGEDIKNCVGKLDQGTTDLIRSMRNDFINKCLNELQIQLAQKQNSINEINIQRGIVTDIEKNIERLEAEEKALDILVTCLSPHDGLIAEGLLGFIKSFVRKMNLLIGKIWTYRLEVQDCSLDSETGGAELDYKFPMLVGDSNDPVPDISKGSGGMQEIINLTFKIVAMQYLDMSNAPLFADELGHAMDAEHKACTVNLIKYLLDHCTFSQLYMISHDYMQYSSMSHVQYCVLNPSNIVVPKNYNEHVEIS